MPILILELTTISLAGSKRNPWIVAYEHQRTQRRNMIVAAVENVRHRSQKGLKETRRDLHQNNLQIITGKRSRRSSTPRDFLKSITLMTSQTRRAVGVRIYFQYHKGGWLEVILHVHVPSDCHFSRVTYRNRPHTNSVVWCCLDQ